MCVAGTQTHFDLWQKDFLGRKIWGARKSSLADGIAEPPAFVCDSFFCPEIFLPNSTSGSG